MSARPILHSIDQIRAEKARRAAVRAQQAAERDGDRIREECRTLAGFIRHAWPILEPTMELRWGWALDAIADHLTAITFGHITRLLVNVPPGLMKSLMTSVFWPAWEWGPMGMPSTQIIGTAHGMNLAIRDTRKMKLLVESEWYQTLWGSQVAPALPWKEDNIENEARGWRQSIAFANLTGGRANRVIVDDPLSTEGAESDAERATAERIMRESLHTRLNDPERDAIVIIMQRLHQKDPSAIAMELVDEGYVHLMLPMEFEPERRCVTSIGFKDPRQHKNELLFPERYNRTVVDRMKKTLRAYGTAGQFQQRPAPREGGLFDRTWFEYVYGLPPRCLFVRAWDLASTKKKQGNDPDWTVGLLLAMTPDGEFIICDVIRIQESAGRVEKTVKGAAANDKAEGRGGVVRLPQDPGQAGKSQANNFITRVLPGYPAKAKPVTGDKYQRALPAAAQAEYGNLKILRRTPPGSDTINPLDDWIEPFLEEVTIFPASAHDDQVDALSDAVDELALSDMKGANALHAARQDIAAKAAEEAEPKEDEVVNLAPGSVEWMMAMQASANAAE